MMTSNLLSRLLPPMPGSPSVYETLRQNDESSDASDIEERAGITIDEENLGASFQDFELRDALTDATESGVNASRTNLREPDRTGNAFPNRTRSAKRGGWFPSRARPTEMDDADDDVPQSLLVEGEDEMPPVQRVSRQPLESFSPSYVPSAATAATRARWQATQEPQRLHQGPRPRQAYKRNSTLAIIDPKEKALWRWANVENLDNFLKDVYEYYLGNGIWCILLSRVLNLLTSAFVVSFSIFLTSCIEYSKIPGSKAMKDIMVPQCTRNMSGTTNLIIWLFTFLWIGKVFQYLIDIRRLWQMHDFYHHLLHIPDTDMQTIAWQEVVKNLMALRDANPVTAGDITERHRRFMGTQSKQRMDAHDIANRLMRRENYLIALFNKDILDLTLPIPFLRNRQLFSKTLEWSLSLCILDYVFNEQGQVRPLFLKDTHRRALSGGLRRRFLFAGFMNCIFAPFIIVYFMLWYFFRYFNEYQRNPSQIGSRQYTPLAEWKFREFNELWHLFQRRINMSYPFASRYIDQFPKDKTIQVLRFVAFVAGALASVLALASVVDPESFLGFEVTPERTVLFYLGIFGTAWAIARGAVPEENLVFDPEYALNNVTEYTHFLPGHWRGRLHSDEVRREFAFLYQMKIVIFLEEILSIIITPFILWFSLPKCSDRLVDFFREFTIHVDGLGYVCSFAVFDFKKGGDNVAQQPEARTQDLRNEYYSTKDGKMLASYYGFIDNYVTNPKAGVPFAHPSSRPHFYPPPAFPGLMPRGTTEESSGRQQRAKGPSILTGPGAGSRLMPRTPRFGPLGGHSSPMASVLLDPQHQPSPPSLKAVRRNHAQSRLRTSQRPVVDPIEDDEDALLAETGQSGDDDDAGDGSSLGDSWKMTRAGTVDEEPDVSDGEKALTQDRGPGVLGLVYQFSRTQTEGRGTGTNM